MGGHFARERGVATRRKEAEFGVSRQRERRRTTLDRLRREPAVAKKYHGLSVFCDAEGRGGHLLLDQLLDETELGAEYVPPPGSQMSVLSNMGASMRSILPNLRDLH